MTEPCPGLFYATPAQDGILSRLRLPGGLLTSAQAWTIADFVDQVGDRTLQITNRANLQIRKVRASLAADELAQLQAAGLASPLAAVDHLRNLMSSPTAGIDPQECLDTRPWVSAWDRYLATRPDFAGLSAKFSVCFDGGGVVSVRDRPNDVTFSAIPATGQPQFWLSLCGSQRGAAPSDTGIRLSPEHCLPFLTALTEVYRDAVHDRFSTQQRRKPRLRDVLSDCGRDAFLHAIQQRLAWPVHQVPPQPLPALQTANYAHLGVQPQRQSGLSYLGVGVPLGQLQTSQLRGLATIATQYGSSTLRFTPWQNLILPDLPNAQLATVQAAIADFGLSCAPEDAGSAIVACTGSRGCAAAATDTTAHAFGLMQALNQQGQLDQPLNIHLSGCDKSCAQHHPSDIALLGTTVDGAAAYHVYIGHPTEPGDRPFGREFSRSQPLAQLPQLLQHLLEIYHRDRHSASESFSAFVQRQSIAHLQSLLCPAVPPAAS